METPRDNRPPHLGEPQSYRIDGDPVERRAYVPPTRPALDTDLGRTERTEVNMYGADRDRVRWGPIIAGFLTAFTTMILLGLLGLAIGLTATTTGDTGLPNAGTTTAIWSGLTALVAFFLGGFVAARTAAVYNRGWGALNGALVFLLTIPALLWIASMGLGALFGTLGQFAAALNIDPATLQGLNPGQVQVPNLTPAQQAQLAENARNAAWSALGGLVLGLVASTLGGMIGTRNRHEQRPSATTVNYVQ